MAEFSLETWGGGEQAPATPVIESWGPPKQPATLASTAWDVAKQIPTGLAMGVEAIPATVPSMLHGIGTAVEKGMDKLGWSTPEMREAVRKREQFAADIGPPKSIADYLPTPETTAGEFTRTALSSVPLMAGQPGNLARNVGVGIGAGLTSEAAGQATKGTEAEPYARFAGALLGGSGVLKGTQSVENALARRAVPSKEAIKAAAGDQYRGLTEAHVATPIAQSELDNLADTLRDTLNRRSVRPSNAEGIHKAIDELRTPASEGAPDVADLVIARQTVKDFLRSGTADSVGAQIALPKIDAAIERLSPGTMQQLREADKNWSAFRASEALDKRLARADLRASGEHSGLNLGNKIRQQAANYLLSPEARYLPASEKAALEGVVHGTMGQNLLRFGSNLLGGGGGLGSTLLGLTGAGAGYATGTPELMLAPVAGLGLRMAANRAVANQAANVGAQMRARSPLAQSMTQPTLPSRAAPEFQRYNNPNYNPRAAGPQRMSALERARLAAGYAIPATRMQELRLRRDDAAPAR